VPVNIGNLQIFLEKLYIFGQIRRRYLLDQSVSPKKRSSPIFAPKILVSLGKRNVSKKDLHGQILHVFVKFLDEIEVNFIKIWSFATSEKLTGGRVRAKFGRFG